MEINIPAEPLHIINTLNNSGFDAYAVGGCVRDSLLGRKPKDWDITTNAKPDEVKALFPNTVDTGIKHGTVTVMLNGLSFEVTTFRTEGGYSDCRRPDSIQYTGSLPDDLGRRDFTANAIAYHPAHGFADPFGGIGDIRSGVLRAVGDAGRRFSEDALRMLRAVRFSAQLDFSIEQSTCRAIKENSSKIAYISSERIRDELTGIITSPMPLKFALLNDTGLLSGIMPEFVPCFSTAQNHPYHIHDVAHHILKAVESIESSPVLRWTMLLHDIGKPVTKTTDRDNIDHFYGHQHKSADMAGDIMGRLRFDSKTADRVFRLVKYHDKAVEPGFRSVRKAAAALGVDIFTDFLKVREADIRAQNPEYLGKRLKDLETVRDIYAKIREDRQCLDLKGLALKGDDLISLGFEPGKRLGDVLNILLDEVLKRPELNSREELQKLAKRYL